MIKVVFTTGVEIFTTDLQAVEDNREQETLRRWNQLVETPGIVAKAYNSNVLMPTTGTGVGQIAVSSGGAYAPNGEYIYSTGITLTGLTDADMFPSGSTYVAVVQSELTGDTRAHVVDGFPRPTREWNDGGNNSIQLVNNVTGATHIVVGLVSNITSGGTVTLDVGEAYRQIVKISSVVKPTTPPSLSIITGPEEDLVYGGTGAPTYARRVENTPAYVSLSWGASSHADGIQSYVARLRVLDDDGSELSGRTLSEILWVGSGVSPSYTGVTFHNVMSGLLCDVEVYAVSNSVVPTISDPVTGASFYVGIGSSSALTMPSLTVVQRLGGVEITWTPADTGTTGITIYEVFASENSSVTGGTVDYATLMYRGFGGRAFIPADIGDLLYLRVRGVDYTGRVTSNDRVGSVTVTGPGAPEVPINIRRTSIAPMVGGHIDSVYQDAHFSTGLRGGIISDKGVTFWEWNWNDINGAGGSASLAASNLSGITTNQLVGYRLWMSDHSTDYIITGNTASSGSNTTLYITDIYGQAVDISGYIANTNYPAVIHCDADFYELEFQTYTDDTPSVEDESMRERVTVSRPSVAGGPVIQKICMPLSLGSLVRLAIRAGSLATPQKSTLGTMATSERIAFDDVASWNTGATISVAGTEYGFEVNLTPDATLDEISGLEIAYKLGSTGVSFTNRDHNVRVIDPVSSIRIAVERAGTYQFAIRPLIGGQVVGNTLSAVVASGGGGYLPNVKALTVAVNIRPNNQTLVYDTGTSQVVITQDAGAVLGIDNPAHNVERKLFTVSSGGNQYIYVVLNQRIAVSGTSETKQVLDIKELTSYGTPLGTLFAGTGLTAYYEGQVATGTTISRTRRLAVIPVDNEIRIVRLSLDCVYTDGTDVSPGIIRVYQQGYSQDAVSLEVNGFGDDPLVNDVSLDITRAKGSLILIIDAYDPATDAPNSKVIVGNLLIQYRDISVKTAETSPGVGGFWT